MAIVELIELGLAGMGFILGLYNILDMLHLKKCHKNIEKRFNKHIDIYLKRHQEVRDMFSNHVDIYYKRHEELRDILRVLSNTIEKNRLDGEAKDATNNIIELVGHPKDKAA